MIEVGDIVKIGSGTALWRVESFFGVDGTLARLAKVEDDGTIRGYTHTSTPTRRLRIEQKRVLV